MLFIYCTFSVLTIAYPSFSWVKSTNTKRGPFYDCENNKCSSPKNTNLLIGAKICSVAVPCLLFLTLVLMFLTHYFIIPFKSFGRIYIILPVLASILCVLAIVFYVQSSKFKTGEKVGPGIIIQSILVVLILVNVFAFCDHCLIDYKLWFSSHPQASNTHLFENAC